MGNNLISVGILVILIGFALVFIGALISLGSGQKDTKVAVGGFIWFIPFGLWNDKRLGITILLITTLMFIVWMFLQFRIGNS